MRNSIERKLAFECLNAAAASRLMWLQMKRTGHGWTWEHYRGWIADARAFRLGTEYKAHGRTGLRKAPRLTSAFTVL